MPLVYVCWISAAGDVDFVFLPGWEKRKGIVSHPISHEELILVAKKDIFQMNVF